MDPLVLLEAIGVCLAASAIGFKKTVWFISIGYTLSILALCVATIVVRFPHLQLWNYLQIGGLGLWAGRLGFFLVQRERSASYTAAVKTQTDTSAQLAFPVKLAIWMAVSILYTCMFFPAMLAAVIPTQTNASIVVWLGIVLLWLGIFLEATADSQKSAFKKKQPHQYCHTGLYAWVRCPNYLGEISVWTGNFIIGIPFYQSWWHWLIAIVGWVCIVLIMMGSTKRLEAKHQKQYGNDPAFQTYSKTVPILFPWLPVYSLKNVKVYLE